MNLNIQSKKPGFEVKILKVPTNLIQDKFSDLFFGSEKKYDEYAIDPTNLNIDTDTNTNLDTVTDPDVYSDTDTETDELEIDNTITDDPETYEQEIDEQEINEQEIDDESHISDISSNEVSEKKYFARPLLPMDEDGIPSVIIEEWDFEDSESGLDTKNDLEDHS